MAELPDLFDSFPALGVLRLEHNRLQQLPPSMCKIPDLRMLDLSHNKLGGVPVDVLRSLTTLTYMDAGYNGVPPPLETPRFPEGVKFKPSHSGRQMMWVSTNFAPTSD